MMRSLARKFGIGNLVRLYYHRPIGLMRLSMAEGGPLQQRKTNQGHEDMKVAARNLPAMAEPSNPYPVGVTYLSGEKYWHQTLFCFMSLQIHTDRKIDFQIFDDGSFTDQTMDLVRSMVPWVKFVTNDDITTRLNAKLPVESYPSLRARRLEYPHLRKLTDIHCQSDGWTLVLDSDMLFFKRPDELLDWMAEPDHPIFMQDVQTYYGYPKEYLDRQVGIDVPERINVGLYALFGPDIDWQKVELWCHDQIRELGTSYLQEQGLTAQVLALHGPRALPDSEYVVKPDLAEGFAPTGALHHYVAEAKRAYFQFGWQEIQKRLFVTTGKSEAA
ncbi:MAG: glycosyl transferase [Pseudomonadota bacterium]